MAGCYLNKCLFCIDNPGHLNRRSMRRGAPVTFPRIIHSKADDHVGEEECFTFCDEARAIMFAGVVEKVFYADTQVIETPHGWIVSVTDRNAEMDMISIHQMEGVCMALCEYTVAPAPNADVNYPDGLKKRYAPETRQAWIDHKAAQAGRIEDGINAILARLGDLEASGRGSMPSASRNAATGAKGRGIEALIPAKAKASGKKSTKRPAAEGHA